MGSTRAKCNASSRCGGARDWGKHVACGRVETACRVLTADWVVPSPSRSAKGALHGCGDVCVFGGKLRSLFVGDCRLSTGGHLVRLRPRCGLCCCCGTRSARRRRHGAAAWSSYSSVCVHSTGAMKIAVRPLLLVQARGSQRDECRRRQGACNLSHLLHVHS